MQAHRLPTRQALCLLFLAFLLAACAQVGLPTPDTFNKRLIATLAVVTEVERSAATLLLAGKIDVADAENVARTTDQLVVGLNIARAMSTTDLPGADARLVAVHTGLVALQAYLASKKGAQP